MRTLPAAIEARIDDEYYTAVHLFELRGGATTYRWVDAPRTVTYNGNAFSPMAFAPGEIVTAEGGSQAGEITFFDIDRDLRAILYNEDWSMRPATIWEAWLDKTTGALIDVIILIDGRADGGQIALDDPTEPVVIPILPETEREGGPGPAQEYSTSCRYVNKFKGLQCGYAGAETTCDGTTTRCSELGNRARYGGAPYAPSPGSVLRIGTTPRTLRTRGE